MDENFPVLLFVDPVAQSRLKANLSIYSYV